MNLHSEQIDQIATALAKAQGMIEGAEKRANNPHYGKKYADLHAVWDACREPLSTNGLSVTQIPTETDNGMVLVTMLMHSSGQWIAARYPVRPVKADPQGYGSAISYARRYTLMAIVGIAPEEDDGNAASGVGSSSANRDDRPQQRAPANSQTSIADRPAKEAAAATLISSVELSEDMDELVAWWKEHQSRINALPDDLKAKVTAAKDKRKTELQEIPQAAE